MPNQWISWKVGEQRRDMITTVPIRDWSQESSQEIPEVFQVRDTEPRSDNKNGKEGENREELATE